MEQEPLIPDPSSNIHNALFQNVFRKHNAIMLWTDPDSGRVMDANLAAEKFYGYSLLQFKRMFIFEIKVQDAGTAAGEEADYFIGQHKLANGETRIVEVYTSPVVMDGTPVLFSIIHDVTEHKNVEEALVSSTAELRDLIASMRDVVLVIDRYGVYCEVAPTNPNLLYKPSNELLGMKLTDVFPAEQAHLFLVSILQVLNIKQPAQIEYKLDLDTGTIWFEATISPLSEDRTLWVARNVTERKQMDAALRESEERYRSLFDTMLDGIYRSTHEGRFLDVNPALVKMFRYSSRQEMLDVDIKNELYFSPQERGSYILDVGEQAIDMYRMRRKDGSEIWVEDHGRYVRDAQGNILYHEGIMRDITERRLAEESFRENESLLKESQIIAGLGSYVLDFTNGLWMSSDVLDQIFGIDKSYIRSVEGWADMIHPDDREGMTLYFVNEVMGHKNRFDKEYRIIRKNDQVERWVHGMGELEIDEQGLLIKMRGSIQDITEQRLSQEALHHLNQETMRRLNHLQTLHSMDQVIASSLDLHITLNILLNHTISQLGVDTADIFLFNPYQQTLQYAVGQGFRTHAVEGAEIYLNDAFAGRSVMERRMVQVFDFAQIIDNEPFARLWTEENFANYICVPLIAKGEIKGVLEVYSRSQFVPDPEWLEFLETLAGQAAITIDNAQMFENLQRVNMELAIAYDATIEGWSRAMDLRDKETEGHTKRVTEITVLLAKAMGVTDKEILHIRRGALLHDIGKMGIPDNILLKEGPLTDEEWTVMRTHPGLAHEMLQPIRYLHQSLDIPFSHHEKWDGTGYPRRLAGEQIPLVARIFAVADVWDAVTSERPYRKAWTKKKALQYIKEQSGKQFDPQVIKFFLKVIK